MTVAGLVRRGRELCVVSSTDEEISESDKSVLWERIKYFIDIFLIIKPATDVPLKVFYVGRRNFRAVKGLRASQ